MKYQSETVNTPITSKLLRIYLKKKTYNKIGITAGASTTPGSIIEEVVKAMSENLKMRRTFAELFAQYESKKLLITGTL